MKHSQHHRPALAALTALAVVGAGGSAATARQDAGDPRGSAYYWNELRNPVSRVDRQIVHGDNLSGENVMAPLHLTRQ